MARHAIGDRLTLPGITGLSIDRALIAALILLARARERVVEAFHHAGANRAALGRFISQHIFHVAAPIIIIAAIAGDANRVRRAEHTRKLCRVREIVRAAHGQLFLRLACAREEECANQEGMKTVLLHAITFARLAARLKRFEQQIDVIVLGEDGAFRRMPGDAAIDAPHIDAAFGNSDIFYSPQIGAFLRTLMASPKLDWFQSAAAGIEHPVLASIGKVAARYTTNHTQAESMAEWALWQALDFLRGGLLHRAQGARAEWKRQKSRELAGSRWLIIGYGSIGEAVGRRVTALGGHVTGVRRSSGAGAGAAAMIQPDALRAALPNADIVLLCTPHTTATERLANAAFFAAMREDALFMNLGRGALVDEAALMAALDAGRPAFAALDVTRTEPLPKDSALWTHPKIALTPHDSADTDGTVCGADETFLANLERWVKDEPLRHVADKAQFAG